MALQLELIHRPVVWCSSLPGNLDLLRALSGPPPAFDSRRIRRDLGLTFIDAKQSALDMVARLEEQVSPTLHFHTASRTAACSCGGLFLWHPDQTRLRAL